MKPHLEIEYKTLLTKEEYQELDTHFKFERIVQQTNVYYDSNNDLYNQHMMCRIRILPDSYEFTLKVPQEEGVLEYEFEMESLDLKHPQVISTLSPYISNLDELQEVGRSETLRKISSDQYGEWCLDSNTFSFHQDYELEYELFQPHNLAYQHYLDNMEKLGIEYKPADPKYIRSLQSKKAFPTDK